MGGSGLLSLAGKNAMRKTLFEKASYLKDRIKAINETDHSIRFECDTFGQFEVVCKYQNNELIFLCTCPQGSVKPLTMCSHKLAVIHWLVNRIGDKNGND